MKKIIAVLACGVFLSSCAPEEIPQPAPVAPQNNIIEVIITGENDSAYVNANLGGNFYAVTDSTYENYSFNINPNNQSYTVYAQYTSTPGDSISIQVLINGSQVTSSTGVGFASCLFVY